MTWIKVKIKTKKEIQKFAGDMMVDFRAGWMSEMEDDLGKVGYVEKTDLKKSDCRMYTQPSTESEYSNKWYWDTRAFKVLERGVMEKKVSKPKVNLGPKTTKTIKGYKKANLYSVVTGKNIGKCIVELRIKKGTHARIGKDMTDKCRAMSAIVTGIYTVKGKVPLNPERFYALSQASGDVVAGLYTQYVTGGVVMPDMYDPCAYEECSAGIHFFRDRKSAVNWLV
jgi:hypothetical protein